MKKFTHFLLGAIPSIVLSVAPFVGGFAAEERDNHQHAHVHGVATLGIAVDRDVLTIQLESPLDSLIGFEHRARTAAERSSVEALKARMKSATGLFVPSPGADCKLQNATADSALFDDPPAQGGSDEHADLDASFEYRCAHVDRLESIDVGLFAVYPKLQHVAVAVATGKGQGKRDLRRPDRTISLSR